MQSLTATGCKPGLNNKSKNHANARPYNIRRAYLSIREVARTQYRCSYVPPKAVLKHLRLLLCFTSDCRYNAQPPRRIVHIRLPLYCIPACRYNASPTAVLMHIRRPLHCTSACRYNASPTAVQSVTLKT